MKKGNTFRRTLLLDICASLLLVVLVHMIIDTYVHLPSLKNMLGFYTTNMAFTAWSILIAQTAIAALLFFPRTRLFGFIGALLAVTLLGVTIVRFPQYPHDFGGIFNNISTFQKWTLITSIAIISVCGIYLIAKRRKQNDASKNAENEVVFT